MNLLVTFDQSAFAHASLVGGKGANLMALSAAGFPVPTGFVVTSEAYREFLSGVPWLGEELSALDYERPDVLREQCRRLRERLVLSPLPPALEEAIGAALAPLEARGGHGEGGPAFAVRSSSTFEDLAQAAFAGQHDTYLNVRGTDSIVRRVRDCYASLWGDRAVLYRRRQGFSQLEARMAVVVQEQIRCDVAGVGFSLDPVSGRTDRMAIDASYGLGEAVVSGEYEVDHYELVKETLETAARSIGRKDRTIRAVPGGVEEAAVPPDLAAKPCLDGEALRRVGALLKRVEDHYGWPQDIEWGLAGGELHLLQSRPVTMVKPRWTRDESAERFPNPMTPLSWDFIRVAFRRSMEHSLALMGLPTLQGDWFEVFGHYVYGNQNAVQLIAAHRPLRARSPQELAAEIPELRRRYSWVLDLPVCWARDLDRYLIRLGRLSAVDLEGASLEDLWRHMSEVLEVASDYFQPNIAISMTQSFLHRLLLALVGMVAGRERALEVLDGLLAGCETKTAVVNREMHELARLARGIPALRDALLSGTGREFWDRGRREEFPDFAARLGKFLDDHGHREMDMDYREPTWCDQPWVVLDSIILILRGEPGEDPAETARRERARQFAAEHAFLGGLPEGLRFFFREMIRLTRTYTTLDDLEHYQTTRVNPIARRAALAMGRKLVEMGILDAPEDVFFFHKADLEALAAAGGDADPKAPHERAYAARDSYRRSREVTPPWSLDETGDGGPEAGAGEGLRGLPGSPGTVTGRCFLVRSPDDFARFPRGSILVARTTNPAWTSLFYSAAGLITESGGPLSHGAVTAREMRLPAVMSVRGVMAALRDGQTVTVDGTRGTVIIGGSMPPAQSN